MRHVNSAVRAAVLLLAASALTLWQHAHAATVKYYWRVTEFEAAYDGVTRTVFGINDRPGIESPINVTIGDEVEVHLTNELSDFTCIHWHGLRQFGTQEMDGVSGITHCRIPPNVTAVYRFTPDKPGTFWYHSHDHVQYAAGLRGPLIVNQKPELLQPWEKDVAGEHVLLVADWYHAPPVGAPIWDTMVINDKGQYNCTVAGALGLNCTDEQPLPRFEVSPGKTYLFRIINGAALAPFDLSIDDHEFQVIAADSDPLVPSRLVNTVRVNVAQRYDILVKTKENATEPFWIRATGLFGEPWTARPADRVPTGFNEKGLAILDYKPNCRDMPTSSNWTTVDLIDEFAYTPLAPVLLPQLSDERYVVEFTLAVLPQNPGAFLGYTNVNQTGFRSLFVPDYPTLFSVASGTPTEQLPSDSNAHRIGEGNHVEIVLCNETPDQHPFHFHGHSPWVVGSGNAPLSEIIADNATDLKLVAPMQHDVFTVPHCTTGVNGQCADVGYVVLRYNADNAGVWMLHCHIDWHFDIGLGMLVVENEAALMAMGLDQFDKQMLNVCNSTGLTRG